MGGSRPIDWLDDLGAAFDATEARDEEVAASDLAFSLRQGADLRAAVRGAGWTLLSAGGGAAAVDEVGSDYVTAGAEVVPASRAVLRTAEGPAPRRSARSLTEWLSEACRRGVEVEVRAGDRFVSGRLLTVGRDHLQLGTGEARAVVGLQAVESVRVCGRGAGGGYSVSRGLRG